MIVVTVHPLDTSTNDYGPASVTHNAPDLGVVMKLFSGSGDSGMAYQYVVSDRDSGEPLVTYYAEQADLANSLPTS